MNELVIEITKETPEISFNAETGVLKISGRAYSNDINMFFKPLNSWLEEYLINPKETTVIELKMEYYNSIFNKLLLIFFENCKTVHQKNKKLVIKWHYEKGDRDSLDESNRISNIIKLEIENIEFE